MQESARRNRWRSRCRRGNHAQGGPRQGGQESGAHRSGRRDRDRGQRRRTVWRSGRSQLRDGLCCEAAGVPRIRCASRRGCPEVIRHGCARRRGTQASRRTDRGRGSTQPGRESWREDRLAACRLVARAGANWSLCPMAEDRHARRVERRGPDTGSRPCHARRVGESAVPESGGRSGGDRSQGTGDLRRRKRPRKASLRKSPQRSRKGVCRNT